MKLTNRFEADEAIVAAVANDSYDATGSDISITGLARSPQQRVLEKRHHNEITEDVSDRLASLRGQVAHSIVERAGIKNEWSEHRIGADIMGWRVTGKPDKYEAVVLSGGILIDHKFPTLSSFLFGFQRDKGLKKDHISQGNSYRWLLSKNGVDVSRIVFKSTLLEWSKRHVRIKKDYPDRPFFNFDIPLWDLGETEKYLHERVKAHQDAEKLPDNLLPPCTDEERWQQAGIWKVYNANGKRSLRNFDGFGAEEAAVAFATEKSAAMKASIEAKYVPGESVKCLDYCRVKKFCHQMKRETPDGIDSSMI